MAATAWIGTSGWQYDSWRGRLYPEQLAKRRWLEHYAERFRTVELNASFYRLPARDAFRRWHDQTPDDFVFAVKASRISPTSAVCATRPARWHGCWKRPSRWDPSWVRCCCSCRPPWRPSRTGWMRRWPLPPRRAGGRRVSPPLLVPRRDPLDPGRVWRRPVPERSPRPAATARTLAYGRLEPSAAAPRHRIATALLRTYQHRQLGAPDGGAVATRRRLRLLQQRPPRLRAPRRGAVRIHRRPAWPSADAGAGHRPRCRPGTLLIAVAAVPCRSMRIEDYALIGDMQTAALVGPRRIDRLAAASPASTPPPASPRCWAAPRTATGSSRRPAAITPCTRRYRHDTLILESVFETAEGGVRMIDFMPPRGDGAGHRPHRRGPATARCRCARELRIRFDYGSVVPWVRRVDHARVGGGRPGRALLPHAGAHRGPRALAPSPSSRVKAGERVPFVLTWYPSYEQPPKRDRPRAGARPTPRQLLAGVGRAAAPTAATSRTRCASR